MSELLSLHLNEFLQFSITVPMNSLTLTLLSHLNFLMLVSEAVIRYPIDDEELEGLLSLVHSFAHSLINSLMNL